MPQTLTLDDLIAFNDELAALARAGVPLGDGLAGLGNDLPTGLSRISRTLAERLDQGQSLADALTASGDQFPPLYRALVTAGIRSGRLPAALEQLGTSARRLAALRRLVLGALVYPVIVVLLTYGLFLFFIVRIAPVLSTSAPLAPHQVPPQLMRFLGGMKVHVQYWGPIVPTLLVVLLVAWWFRSRRAMVLQSGIAGRVLGTFAPLRRLLNDAQAAGLAETLSLLVEHQTPLPEAVTLAAETTGDKALLEAARQLAAEIASGSGNRVDPPRSQSRTAERQRSVTAIPPLLHWLIVTGAAQPNLAAALRQNAEMYRRRAIARADWLRWRLPVLLTLGIGGTATLIYALILFVPWFSLLKELSQS